MAFPGISIGGVVVGRDREPDTCPLCHHAISPKEHVSTVTGPPSAEDRLLECVFQCPRRECGQLFIARYRRFRRFDGVRISFGEFEMVELVPTNPKPAGIPKEVGEISPNFVTIYEQAIAAESYGLDQIAGAGYRKSLEFLVKDYCILKQPGAAEEIKKSWLGQCIGSWVEDAKVKGCAKRAAWLGNDETHYLRKWESKDINDLKILITLTVNWIHNDILTERYMKEMS